MSPLSFARKITHRHFKDIGCGTGNYLRSLSASHSDFNFLGIELRTVIVDSALFRLADDQKEGKIIHRNIHFIQANTFVASPLFDSLPRRSDGSSVLDSVSILFPDPCFKISHRNRRMINPTFVDLLARTLSPVSNTSSWRSSLRLFSLTKKEKRKRLSFSKPISRMSLSKERKCFWILALSRSPSLIQATWSCCRAFPKEKYSWQATLLHSSAVWC